MLVGYKSAWTPPMSGCNSALAQLLSCTNLTASASFAPGTETLRSLTCPGPSVQIASGNPTLLPRLKPIYIQTLTDTMPTSSSEKFHNKHLIVNSNTGSSRRFGKACMSRVSPLKWKALRGREKKLNF